jgi:N-acetyl sugar amidotransferase
MLKYCKNCLTTNLRPNASFNIKTNVCIACEFFNADKNKPNKKFKLEILKRKINNLLKKNRNSHYDCIIGISGGKDSTRQALWVKNKLKLKPLLVCCSYPPRQMSKIGAQNITNLIKKNFEVITVTPAPLTSAKFTHHSFKKYGNVCKSTELALFSSVPRIAAEFGINLIFWGENPSIQLGDSKTYGQDDFDGSKLYNLNTLKEGNNWLKKISNIKKIHHYSFPNKLYYKKKIINIIYLGPAWDDWSNYNNSYTSVLEGLVVRPYEEKVTGDISNTSMLDEEFTNINMMIKYYKFGFGRATDILNEYIREGRISRLNATKIAKKYDGICSDKIIKKFCKYISISEKEFWLTVKKHSNSKIFDLSKKKPKRKFEVGENYKW